MHTDTPENSSCDGDSDSDATQMYVAPVEDSSDDDWEGYADAGMLWEKDLDDGDSDGSTQPRKKQKKGGAYNLTNFEKKMHCVDVSIIREFLATTRCGCEKRCLYKLYSHGKQGEQVTKRLRQARFTGKR